MFGFESLSSTTREKSLPNLASICMRNCRTINYRMLIKLNEYLSQQLILFRFCCLKQFDGVI